MILLLGLIVIYYSCGRVTVRPILIGKVATVLQMVCVLWGLFKWNSTWLEFWSAGAALCTGVSGLYYFYEGSRQLSASPSSAAAPGQGR